MAIEDLLGYLAKGALLIIDLTLVILIIGPFVIGYGIVIIFLNIVDTIRDHLPKHQPVYRLSKDDLKRIDWEMNLPVPKLGNTVVPVKSQTCHCPNQQKSIFMMGFLCQGFDRRPDKHV